MKLIIFSLCIFVLSIQAEKISIVTEEYPPYNYFKDNHIIGMSVEVVHAVAKEADIKFTHEIFPWARAYLMARRDKNTLIHSIGRSKKRENLFQWVGIIAPAKFCLISLKNRDDINIKSLKNLKNYKIGAVRDDIQEKYLINNGFEREKHIITVNKQQQNFDLLIKKRIDMWATVELTGYHITRENHYQPNKLLQTKYCFDDLSSEGTYMAFSKNTAKSIVLKFKQALQKIKNDGTYDRILRKYL